MTKKLCESVCTFVISAGRRFGLGHARRMQSVASVLVSRGIRELSLILVGTSYHDALWPEIVRKVGAPFEISDPKMRGVGSCSVDFDDIVRFPIGATKYKGIDIVFLDITSEHANSSLKKWARGISKVGYLVGIDHVALDATWPLDLRWVPSFYRSENWPENLDIKAGWDKYLLQPPNLNNSRKPAQNVLVLTGGSDAYKLSESWPLMLAALDNQGLSLTWVRGPFSRTPHFPPSFRHIVEIVDAPERLDNLFLNADVVLTVHGTSVFEALSYRRKVVTYCPKNTLSNGEIEALRKSGQVFVATEAQRAVEMVFLALASPRPPPIIDGLGPKRLVDSVEQLLQARHNVSKV